VAARQVRAGVNLKTAKALGPEGAPDAVIERQARIPIGHTGRLWVEVRSGSFASILTCPPHVRLDRNLGHGSRRTGRGTVRVAG
jgi:hypothetical protein